MSPESTTAYPASRAALEALAAARAISQASNHTERIVSIDSTGYHDVLGAVCAAVPTLRLPVAGITYLTVVLEATYDAHGAHLVPDQDVTVPDGVFLTVVVAIRAAFPVDQRTSREVVASVDADLRALEAELGSCSAEQVFVVVQPGAYPSGPEMKDALGQGLRIGDEVAVSTYDDQRMSIERTTVVAIHESVIEGEPGPRAEVVLDGYTEMIASNELVRLG